MDSLYLFLFTKIASTEGFLVAVALIVIWLISKRNPLRAFCFAMSALGLMLSTQILKETLRIPRPNDALIEAAGYAFPSGHASGSVFLALALCYLARNMQKPLRHVIYGACAIAAIAICLSRIDLGVHTPLQVAAGCLLGVVLAIVFILVSNRTSS